MDSDADMRQCWTLLLAAGESRRFGGVKALVPWGGTPLIRHMLATAQAVTDDRVIVVLGAQAEAIRATLGGVRTVMNEAWTAGMGGSLACGMVALQRLDAGAATVLVLPVDQPLVTAMHLRRLAARCAEAEQCVLTGTGAVQGPPAAIPARLFGATAALKSETGMKGILKPGDFSVIEDSDALCDADTPAALDALTRKGLKKAGR